MHINEHACLLLSHNVDCDVGCRWRRYVCEDRYTAIRWAIAVAQKGDVVVVAGKGDQDWTEVSDGRGGFIRVCIFALIRVCTSALTSKIAVATVDIFSCCA